MFGTAWAADKAAQDAVEGKDHGFFGQPGNLGRRRLRAVRRACWARSCGPRSPSCSTSASADIAGRGRRRATAQRGHRGQGRGRADAGPGDRRGRGASSARPARKRPACRPVPPPACSTPLRCASSRRSTASPSRKPPPPSRCATQAVDVALARHPQPAARAGRHGQVAGPGRPGDHRAATPPALRFRTGLPAHNNRGLPLAPVARRGLFFAAVVSGLAPCTHVGRKDDEHHRCPIPGRRRRPAGRPVRHRRKGQDQGPSDLDPIYKALLDRPITVTLGLIGPDGSVGLTPMWFDYEGDQVLVNTASHRRKCDWIRKKPQVHHPDRQSRQRLPLGPTQVLGGARGTGSGARWRTGDAGSSTRSGRSTPGTRRPMACAIPPIDEKRVLFVCNVDRIATFGKP